MKTPTMRKKTAACHQQGFTLVEVLLALLISLIIISAITLFFQGMNKTHTTQSELANVEQNLRAVTTMMARDLRMANYSPLTAQGGIQDAQADSVTFTYEAGTDGVMSDDGELLTVQYLLYYVAADKMTKIGRKTCSGDNCTLGSAVPIAENIDAIEFLYLDKDGEETSDTDKITAITFSVLARSDREDREFLNTLDYFPASCPQPDPPAAADDSCISGAQWTAASPTWNFDGTVGNGSNAFNDHYRRRLITSTVELRN